MPAIEEVASCDAPGSRSDRITRRTVQRSESTTCASMHSVGVGGIELAVVDAYGLEPLTRRTLSRSIHHGGCRGGGGPQRRTTAPVLPAHHRRLGVDRFLCVDNGLRRRDGRIPARRARHGGLACRAGSYRHANCGAAWFDLVPAADTAADRWCLIVDADELFVFPGYEDRTIGRLRDELGSQGVTRPTGRSCSTCTARGYRSEARYQTGPGPGRRVPYFYYVGSDRLRIPFKGTVPQHHQLLGWRGGRGSSAASSAATWCTSSPSSGTRRARS